MAIISMVLLDEVLVILAWVQIKQIHILTQYLENTQV